jgi:predicted transcriptional regulator
MVIELAMTMDDDFDTMMARLKKGKRRKKADDEDSTDLDDRAIQVLDRMKKAAEDDMELNTKRLPAVEKLKILPEFLNLIHK